MKLASHQLPSPPPHPPHPRRFLVWPRFRFRAVLSITLRCKTKPGTQEVFLLVLLDARGIAGRMHHTFTRETYYLLTCVLYSMFFALWLHVLMFTHAQCQFVYLSIGQVTMNNNNNNLFIYSALFNMLGDRKRITTINNLKTIRILKVYKSTHALLPK